MLDEEDTAAAKIEDDSHMDKYTLIKERYDCPKYPMVFCHGLFGELPLSLASDPGADSPPHRIRRPRPSRN